MSEPPWWASVTPHTVLASCRLNGATQENEVGALTVDGTGFQYRSKSTFGIGWPEVGRLDITENRIPHGRKRSAFGFGLIGLAVVGATVAHNRGVRPVEIVRVVTITTRTGQQFHFIPGNSSLAAMAPTLGLIELIRSHGSN